MSDQKICPIRSERFDNYSVSGAGNCIEHQCGWYIDYGCAMKVIAVSLKQLAFPAVVPIPCPLYKEKECREREYCKHRLAANFGYQCRAERGNTA
jgi:hypothetical protein